MSRRTAQIVDVEAITSLVDDCRPGPAPVIAAVAVARRPVRATKSKDVLPLPTSKAKGKSGGRDGRDENLSEYLSSLGRIPLLTAEDEVRLASTLKDAEVGCWHRLLLVKDGVTALAGSTLCTDNPALLARVQQLEAALSDDAPVDTDLVAAIAEDLRRLDDERQLVTAVLAVVDEACGRGVVSRQVLVTARTARRKSLEIRNTFVRANLRLVVSVARRFHHFRMPLIDLIQEGNLGLIKSVHRFDHTKGFRFSTYAHWWIRQAIERAIMNKGAQVRLPVHVFDARREVAKVTRDLTFKLGHEPTTSQVAEGLGITLDKLNEVLASVPRDPVSLDDPLGDDEDRTLAEAIAGSGIAPDEQVIAHDEETRVKRMLTKLTPMEIDIITRRFGLGTDDDETLEEIGKSYSLSRERVRQIQVQGIKKIQRCVEQRASL